MVVVKIEVNITIYVQIHNYIHLHSRITTEWISFVVQDLQTKHFLFVACFLAFFFTSLSLKTHKPPKSFVHHTPENGAYNSGYILKQKRVTLSPSIMYNQRNTQTPVQNANRKKSFLCICVYRVHMIC